MEKVGQKVWEIEINKPVENNRYSTRKKGVTIKEFKIIGISQYKICVDTPWFCTFYKKEKGRRRSSHETYLNDISVSVRTKGSILDEGVFITLYSTKKPTRKTLEKMVATAKVQIDKDYGFLFSGISDELYDLTDNYKFNQLDKQN